MRVETERSRNGYRTNSNRKYDERFRRKNYRHNDHHYHSPRISLKPRHHHNEDYSVKRIGNSPSSHLLASRFDRQANNRDTYSSSLNNQLNSSPPPPTDLYYVRERDSSTHYNDSERNRYSSNYQYTSPTNKSDQFKPSFRRESSPPQSSASSSSYRNEYRSSMDQYNELYRSSDYKNHSERYDISSQNRNCSITATSSSSPVYYQTSSSYNTRDEYTQSFPPMREVDYRTRDYGLTTTIDHHQTASNALSSNHYLSYQDRSNLKRSRSDFDYNSSKRPMRR